MSSAQALPSPHASKTTLRVAVLGAGTVGREVVRGLARLSEGISERRLAHGNPALELTAVAVRDLDRARRSGIPDGLLSDAPAHLVADPGIDVIVELLGGDEPARTLIEAALRAGKSVVTANKHVLAHHGARLEQAARASGATLRFEAAVGGGTPVLGPIARELAATRVTRIRGIVNGTTNFILGEMDARGREYADALADAQQAGYAESDPTADVEGLDAANKLVILIRLAFGLWLDPAEIERRPPTADGRLGQPGISGVSAREMAAAAALGGTIKLVADAELFADRTVAATVCPTWVSRADPLGRVSGVTNRVEVRADPLGSVAFTGPGAGGPATSAAVLADLAAIERGDDSTWAGLPPAVFEPDRLVGGSLTNRDRSWFVCLPSDVDRGPVGRAIAGTGLDVQIASGPTASGLLVRQAEFAAVRALAESLPGLGRGTVYPADVPMSVPQ